MLEQIGADEQIKGALRVDSRRLAFHVLLDPVARLDLSHVHEFNADGPAINAACFAGQVAVDLQFGMWLRAQEPEWIKVGLKVSPATESVENTLALERGCFHVFQSQPGFGSLSLTLSNSHEFATRIMDDEPSVRDSGERQVQQHEPSDWSVFRRGISYLKTS